MFKKLPNLSNFYKFWIYFFPIASYYFYNYVGFNSQICKAIYFFSLPLTILISFSQFKRKKKNKLYANLIRNILILMFFSMIMAYLFWGQGFLLSYRVTAVFMSIVYFFFLMKSKPDLQYIEKVIWFFSVLYIILWIYGLIRAPNLTFGFESESGIDDSRGIFRLEIPGRAFLILSYFLAINKYVKTKELKWVAVFSFLFIVIVMQVIRQIIIFSFLVGFIYLLQKNKYLWIWLLAGGIVVGFLNSIKINDDSIFGRLIAVSKDQADQQKSGDDDIRIREYKYFSTSYSKNIFTNLFGNGVAHTEGDFGKMEAAIVRDFDFYASDVGYAEVFIRIGLVGLILYGFIFYRILRQHVSSKFMYAKLFMIYMIFANIAASWVFQDAIVICICLYILEVNHLKEKILHKNLGKKLLLVEHLNKN